MKEQSSQIICLKNKKSKLSNVFWQNKANNRQRRKEKKKRNATKQKTAHQNRRQMFVHLADIFWNALFPYISGVDKTIKKLVNDSTS